MSMKSVSLEPLNQPLDSLQPITERSSPIHVSRFLHALPHLGRSPISALSDALKPITERSSPHTRIPFFARAAASRTLSDLSALGCSEAHY